MAHRDVFAPEVSSESAVPIHDHADMLRQLILAEMSFHPPLVELIKGPLDDTLESLPGVFSRNPSATGFGRRQR